MWDDGSFRNLVPIKLAVLQPPTAVQSTYCKGCWYHQSYQVSTVVAVDSVFFKPTRSAT
jgi:hypothetical protein